MTGGRDLLLAVADGTATVTLNRPQVRNAVTLGMWQAMPDLFARLGADGAVRSIVVRGAGTEAFTSGADIAEFERERGPGGGTTAYNAAYETAVEAVAACPKPTVAMIHGFCMGGGVGLALACDLRFAGASARFAVPAARLSIAYPVPSVRRLVALVGPARAKDILFSARTFGADEALRVGFADRVVPPADLEWATQAYLADLARLAPLSQQASKAVVNALVDGRPAEGCEAPEAIARLLAACAESEDYAEGIRAFREKRPPRFVGR